MRCYPNGPPTRKFFLTNFIVRWKDVVMIDVAVIDNAAAAEAALEPARARLLARLTEPQSAAMRAAAASYVISPSALAAVAPDPARAPDRLSARWLLALAAQLVRDVGDLITGATRAQRKLATFAMDGTVRFASAADRAAFTAELMQAVTSLVAKYHDERAEGGREHHLVVAIHPSITAAPDASMAAPDAGA